eukprot:6074373-Amphidinium_carterae.1
MLPIRFRPISTTCVTDTSKQKRHSCIHCKEDFAANSLQWQPREVDGPVAGRQFGSTTNPIKVYPKRKTSSNGRQCGLELSQEQQHLF